MKFNNMDSESHINRRERKKLETRQKITKIAMYLFKKQGFGFTTMEQIAEEVDISKATLYNYFPVKESIISEYWQNNVKDLKYHLLKMIQLMPDTSSRIEKTFARAANELFKSKQDIYKVYLNHWLRNFNNPSVSVRKESGFEDIFSMILKLGQQSGDIRKDLPLEIMVKHLEFMFLTACINWLSDPKLFSLEKTLNHTVLLFLDGAGTGARSKKTKIKSDGKDASQGSLL
ncbi:MAG: TetR/AcrR family transcriptional regulator [Nitrospiraceae bacterium]|nr:MAG: TetR/AcrR family transcriptional regulator [Nitrospiraceae bacterium]